MHSTSESLRLIESAPTVELLAFSPDGDPLALVTIPKDEAFRLVQLPRTMGHVFRVTRGPGGRVTVEAVEG